MDAFVTVQSETFPLLFVNMNGNDGSSTQFVVIQMITGELLGTNMLKEQCTRQRYGCQLNEKV